MVDKICSCDHEEKAHKMRDKSPAEILYVLRESRYVEVQHHPEYAEPVGYFVKNENKMYTAEEMYNSIVTIRDSYSPCKKMFCKCKVFKADNLKYLEKMCERTSR